MRGEEQGVPGDTPGGHFGTAGGSLVGMGTLAAVVGSSLTWRLGPGVGFLDGPTVLVMAAVMLAVGAWMRRQAE